MRGCLIGSNIHGKDLDAPEFEDFFAALSQIDVPAYIHPILPAGRERMGDYRLDVLLGFPVDTTIAAARLVFGKVMERHPNLRFVLSHMGGTLPFLWGRISRGFDTFPEVKRHFPGDAAEWFKKFYYDSITFDPSILRNAIEWVGVEQVVFGTDDPFFGPDNMRNCLATVQECPGLSDADKRAVLTDTPRRLFGIAAE
jgi:aminocarboxymuconate-semialdehyde decarboxylase